MDISVRLETIAGMVHKCNSVADIGTDHGYIPLFLIKKGVCDYAIASDINEGPIEKARLNISLEGLSSKIECRLGGGLSTIKPFEVQSAIIAGMGGHLIKDILQEDEEVFKSLEYAILQPVQNPEALREFIYAKGYKIIDEEICFDMGKYYEIIKIKYDDTPEAIDSIFYEVGLKLIDKKHPLAPSYINYKISKYKKILESLTEDTESSKSRKKELMTRISKLKDVLACI